jgi:hypothetical protein
MNKINEGLVSVRRGTERARSIQENMNALEKINLARQDFEEIVILRSLGRQNVSTGYHI